MPNEPGPFAVRDPMPLHPRIVTPHLFEGLAADLAGVLGGVDQGLGAIAATLAPAVGTDIDPAFGADLASAVTALEGLGPVSDQAELAAIAGAGAAIGQGADAQQLDLPGPEESEPPPDEPPFEHEPGGPEDGDGGRPPQI